MKVLILIIALYVGYRLFRSWVRPGALQGRGVLRNREPHADDIMVQDPVCEVYIPRKEGVSLRVKGRDLYFCSHECKEKYEKMHPGN